MADSFRLLGRYGIVLYLDCLAYADVPLPPITWVSKSQPGQVLFQHDEQANAVTMASLITIAQAFRLTNVLRSYR